jgi:flagellar motility protein MotE (MotC chaperone)
MARVLAVLIGVLSCTVLSAELLGLGYLWSKGCLTNSNLYEIRLILTGEAKSDDSGKTEEPKASGASQQEVQAARVMRVLDLESRGKELELLKTLTENRANQLISDQKSFDEKKGAFETELVALKERQQAEAVEQARAVLLASSTEAAVERLMELPIDEAVIIVRGMPEKSIAKILQGFDVPGKADAPLNAGSTPEDRRTRGKRIFEALSRGEPTRTLIQDTLSRVSQEVPQGAAVPSPGGG